ncbi:hypothetical protein [Thermoactinomyces sp. CICC 10522]|uniref:putative amidoligase domain-containing protein n=1 Tax=Thermoactinomyces sp. CICC 10522 TaxID=2767427 RepID=UPI0018DB88E0|nr:hypothetical protein [Thermoactinomyces sp. CICC 10522]MBH8604450.1 hypothetical protein [Thermoactinomyces sp. CICC 10522]
MGTITLPYLAVDHGKGIRDFIVEKQNLASTIRLELPEASRLSEYMLVLNDEKQVTKCRNLVERNRILLMHGLPVAVNATILREYILAVFQTRVLLIYRSVNNSAFLPAAKKQRRVTYRRVPLSERTRETRKAQELAIRAVYALGLDYGVVKLGIGTGRKMVIQQVNPSPRLNKEMETAYVQAITQYMKGCARSRTPLEEIVLGADPEFVMESPQGKLLIASNYFPVRGKVGCDAIWLGQNRSHKPLVELRPDPTPNPRQLVVRIYQSLIFANKKMGKVPAKWLAGAMPYEGFPLGGHIHFSGIQPDFKLLRALDNYLAMLLVIAEDEKGKRRRPKYGFLGDFRYQDYGGFEYRTPPSWLVSPTLTKGVFVTAKLIAANYKQLRYNPLADVSMQEAYYKGRKQAIADWLPILWQDLKQCPDYKVYQTYLDDFYHYLASGITWDESQDFRKFWRLPPYGKKKTEQT